MIVKATDPSFLTSMMRDTSPDVSTFSPSTAVITSPALTPAAAAGPSTEVTNTPLPSAIPKNSASCFVKATVLTPIRLRAPNEKTLGPSPLPCKSSQFQFLKLLKGPSNFQIFGSSPLKD